MRNFWLSFILCMLYFPFFAQVTEDFGVWNTFSYSTELMKKLELEIDQEFRFGQNATQLERAFTDFGLTYEISKAIRIGGHYRYIFDRRTEGIYGHRQRFAADLRFRHKYHRLTFANRLRMQWEERGRNYEASRDRGFETNLRNTFKCSYRLNRRYQPYANVDVRYVLDDPNFPTFQGFDRLRFGLGMDMEINQHFLFGTYFMVSEPLLFPGSRLFIIGTELSFGSSRNFFGT